MFEVVSQNLLQIHDLRLVADERQHDHAEGLLKLRVLVELIQDDIRVGITTQIDAYAHALAARLIGKVRDSVDSLILNQLGNLLDQTGLIDHIRKLCDNNPALAVRKSLDLRDRAGSDLAAAGRVGLLDSAGSEDRAPCRKIRAFYDLKKLLDRRILIPVDLVVDDAHDRIDRLTQVMRRDIGRHTDRDTGRSVDQKVRVARGKNRRFLLRLIKVRDKIDRVFIDIGDHLRGDLRQARLCVSHSRGAVAVDRAEVAVSVDQRIARRPLLSHVDEGPVDGGVTVRVIFTHRITDDTGAFTMRLIRTVVQLDHGVQNAALNRLESVADVRQRARSDNAHRVIDIRALHRLLQIYFVNLVVEIVRHISIPFFI